MLCRRWNTSGIWDKRQDDYRNGLNATKWELVDLRCFDIFGGNDCLILNWSSSVRLWRAAKPNLISSPNFPPSLKWPHFMLPAAALPRLPASTSGRARSLLIEGAVWHQAAPRSDLPPRGRSRCRRGGGTDLHITLGGANATRPYRAGGQLERPCGLKKQTNTIANADDVTMRMKCLEIDKSTFFILYLFVFQRNE